MWIGWELEHGRVVLLAIVPGRIRVAVNECGMCGLCAAEGARLDGVYKCWEKYLQYRSPSTYQVNGKVAPFGVCTGEERSNVAGFIDTYVAEALF